MSVSTPTPVVGSPADGIGAAFETAVAINPAQLKPVLEWLVQTVKGMEANGGGGGGGGGKRPAWSGLQDHVKELTNTVKANEEAILTKVASKDAVKEAVAACEARMEAQMAEMKEEMAKQAQIIAEEASAVAQVRQKENAAAETAALGGASTNSLELEGRISEAHQEVKQLRADVLEKMAMLEQAIPRKADGTALAGLEEQVKAVELRLNAAKDEEERMQRLVRGMQERHQMQQDRMLEQQEHQEKLEEQCAMLREKLVLVEKSACGPQQQVDLGDGERNLVAETQVLVDALDKRCHDNEWSVRKLEQQVSQCTALMSQNVARIGPLEEEVARKADARGLEALVQQLGQAQQFTKPEIELVGEPKAQIVEPTAQGEMGFYDGEAGVSSSNQQVVVADNSEAMDAVRSLRTQLNAQAAQLNALRSKSSCTVDRADLEETISAYEANLKDELNNHVVRLSGLLDLATEERHRISLRCDSHDSMLDGIIPMLRNPVKASPASPAAVSQAPIVARAGTAASTAGLDRLNFQVQNLEQRVNELAGATEDMPVAERDESAEELEAVPARLADAELRITDLTAQLLDMGEVLAALSNGEGDQRNMAVESPHRGVVTDGAVANDDIQKVLDRAKSTERSQKALSQGLKTVSGLLRQNTEVMEALRVKVATMGHAVGEIKGKVAHTIGLCEGKLDTSDARWFVKREDLDLMEGRIQQCSIDLTHKADKELVDELIKQRELAEADKPASVATDESFNEHDLALRVAINNSISELGRHAEQLHALQITIGQKSSADQVDMLARLVEHLKEKVDRVPTIIQAGENGVLFEMAALKQSVTMLFKEQKRTDAVQSREIAEIEAKLDEQGTSIDDLAGALEGFDAGATSAGLPTSPGGSNAAIAARRTSKSNIKGRRGSVGGMRSRRSSAAGMPNAATSAVSQEALVTDVAEAVHGVFAQRFRAIDQSLQHKVDIQDFHKRVQELKQLFKDNSRQPWSPSRELSDVGTPDGHFVTTALPASHVINPKKYANQRHVGPSPENIVLPRLVPPSTIK